MCKALQDRIKYSLQGFKGTNKWNSSLLAVLSVQFAPHVSFTLFTTAFVAKLESADKNRALIQIYLQCSASGLLVFAGLANLNLSKFFVDCDQTPAKLISLGMAFPNPQPRRIRSHIGNTSYDDFFEIALHFVD